MGPFERGQAINLQVEQNHIHNNFVTCPSRLMVGYCAIEKCFPRCALNLDEIDPKQETGII